MAGIIAFVLALCLLSGYTVYCLRTGAKHPNLLALLRFVSLGVLVLLLARGVLWWGFRWVLFLVVLCILALISLFQMLRHRTVKPFRRGWAILAWFCMAVLLTGSLLPAIIFPQYRHPEVTGSYNVATARYTYTDTGRIEPYTNTGEYRKVNVKFWYPASGAGTYPLAVFSHGFCGIQDSNESTYTELASHGYVVCSIDHPYQSFYTVDDTGKVTTVDSGYMKEYASLGDDLAENLKLFQKWMDIRVTDISFTIDTILSKTGGIYDEVDHSAIGVFGHSLGGAAAMGVPRVRQDIRAVINLDAPMFCEFTGVENGRYTLNQTPYPVPLLNIYSQYLYENGIEKNDPEYFENRIVSATAPASYEVYFRGSQHMSLTDLVLFSPPLADLLNSGRRATVDKYACIETMNQMILSFFNCYLKGQGEFNYSGAY